MKKSILFLSILLIIPSLSWAACSDCDTSSASCSAGTTVAQVNTCIGSLPNEGIITFANGNYTWGSSINLPASEGVTLACASEGGCDVAATGLLFYLENFTSHNYLYRITGFDFTGLTGRMVWLWAYDENTITKFRFDHNTVTMSGVMDLLQFGEGSTGLSKVYGVIDNNTFTNSNANSRIAKVYGSETWPTNKIGTGDNLFFEDNTINFATESDLGTAAIDMSNSNGVVIRYNTLTNGRFESHGYYAGFKGTANVEMYNNDITMNAGSYQSGYRRFHHQGSGEWLVFNNTVNAGATPHSDGIALQNYRSSSSEAAPPLQCDGTNAGDGNTSPIATYRGYPCKYQLGRNASAALKPVYTWNNKWTDNNTSITPVVQGIGGTDYISLHLVNNRDYYYGGIAAQTSTTSPFNGTTGVGFGTVANRPGTCTTGAESGGGVGYFATDVGAQGTLYRCSATNTWTVQYAPYTYPHPLTGGADETAPTLTSITIGSNGTSWSFLFSETVTGSPTSDLCDAYTTAMTTAGAVTLSYASGDGTSTIVCTGSPTVYATDTVANGGVDYTQPGNGIEDAAGNDLATFTNKAVTNNSTQQVASGYNMGVTLAGNGTGEYVQSGGAFIDCGATCTFEYEASSVVTLYAFHPDNRKITWGGTDGGGCSGETCQATMSAARAITATFSNLTGQITLSR